MAHVAIEKLNKLRNYGGARKTIGLTDDVVIQFCERDSTINRAIDEALARHESLREEYGEALAGDEAELVVALQEDFVNFYPAAAVNPYVALAARGPWVVTSHGAVLHDSGGYGMLGGGHGPDAVMEAMAENWVMANVMTPSFSQKRLADRMRREVGHTRGTCPYHRFLCMNSGSESVTVASRISDVNALRNAEGRQVKFLALTGGFHGRTDRPAQVSDSCLPKYREALASFKVRDNLITVTPNDCAALRDAFERAEADGIFIEMMFVEPVMGEGNPGEALQREFYDLARQLTKAHGSLLLIDSIQAGLRGTGCLSIVDYPGFEDAEEPDLETFSKALNAGQYPLSVLAMNERAANMYVRGIYGNTMTANPRALEVACAVLDRITPEMRQNVRDRGIEFVEKLESLAAEFPGCILKVQGTGLLLAAELDPERFDVVSFGGFEEWCRRHGMGVIHGGQNALRFTPHFGITSEEIDAIIDVFRVGLGVWTADQRDEAVAVK